MARITAMAQDTMDRHIEKRKSVEDKILLLPDKSWLTHPDVIEYFDMNSNVRWAILSPTTSPSSAPPSPTISETKGTKQSCDNTLDIYDENTAELLVSIKILTRIVEFNFTENNNEKRAKRQ